MSNKYSGNYGESPYPGLRYYEANQADYFAGREEAAKACTVLLGTSRVVILHGRSGCGKSSFLRAGVKPLLEQSDRRSSFPKNFDVVRSTENPMREFGSMLLGVCTKLVEGDPESYWQTVDGTTDYDFSELRKLFDTEAKQDAIRARARPAHRLLIKLCEVLRDSPVFVVDQGEEVFTLYEKRVRELARFDDDDPRKAELERERDDLEGLANEFFELIGRVAERGPTSVRIVVSLRTEYKGQLDDKISMVNGDVSKIKGFYLEDLNEEGLVAAIERPTLKADDWEKLLSGSAVASQTAPSEHWKFGFERDDAKDIDVAKALARMLVDSEQVPEGGVLPTLQIACLRLWEQAREASNHERFTIKSAQLRRIGSIDSQVQEFLSQRLEEACRMAAPWKDGEDEAAERWHRILFRQLVEVQADGRAVTRTISHESLVNAAVSVFREEVGKTDERLRSKIHKIIGYLRKEGVALLSWNENDSTLSLGHDSVALSLNKWHVKYNQSDRSMARSMMMGEIADSAKYVSRDLFPRLRKHLPHETQIVVHRDDHWDRQFVQFALEKGFADRLGIKFVDDPSRGLDLTKKQGAGRLKSWDDLSDKLRKAERYAYRNRTHKVDPVNERVLVAADWASFPRINPERSELKSEDLKDLQRSQFQNWSDILVTNMYTGNALIGPEIELTNSLKKVRDLHARTDPGTEIEGVIEEAFQKLVECNGLIQCHDRLAVEFIRGAAKIVCGADSDEYRYVSRASNVRVFEIDDSRSLFPLADWFLDGAGDGDERPRFMVGTAATRAIALQGGGQLYFGTSELTRLTRTLINKERSSEKTEAQGEDDLHELIQRVIKHTTWQLGISPTQWNQGRNRALVLRLASVGYFTAEYIRSNADEYVRFILTRLNDQLSDGDSGKGASRGTRMNRDSIRSAVQECYSILRFDEYGTEFYDLDSTTAYATEHARFDSKSVASEIYGELAALRQRTIVHYEAVSRMIIWLRDRDGYELSDRYVREVSELKDCAWRNFKIFNFYDAARFMSEAALALQREIETHEFSGNQ